MADGIKDISQLGIRPSALQLGRTPTTAEGAKTASNPEIDKAATDFEALLLQQMFQSMWSSVKSEGLLSGGREEEYFRDMFNEALAQSVAKGKGLGIKDILAKDMAKAAGKKEEKQNP